jgi:hypothetical protein
MHTTKASVVTFAAIVGATVLALLLAAAVLHLIPRSARGRRLSEVLCRAPALDGVVTYFTILPMVAGAVWLGWLGLLAAIAGQVAAVLIWSRLHEAFQPREVRGPRIVTVINRLIGRWRNHAALWLTAVVTPMFWLVRLVELVFYPPLRWLVGFPRYRSGEWVNVSRQKFQGLVGYDLIWCLYCDWMTGVWSLGSEMLRNVESFWCPIRFDSRKKCDNCAIDFPDLDNGWVDARAGMADVVKVLEHAHANGEHAWYGHPVRLTVRGHQWREFRSESERIGEH